MKADYKAAREDWRGDNCGISQLAVIAGPGRVTTFIPAPSVISDLMSSVFFRRGLASLAAVLAVSIPLLAQQPATPQQSTTTFRWIDFHSPKDQNIVTWVTRSLQVENWTAIREIGVLYDAALVVTTDRATPQSLPNTDTFNVWSVSLTSHAVTPLLSGVHLRWSDWERFSRDTPLELPVLYQNCRNCAATTYFTSFHYDPALHAWTARWIRSGQGIPVWNTKPPSGVLWTQVYALLPEGGDQVAMFTWNHFDYGPHRHPEDFIYRYDIDPFSGLDRTVLLSGPDADAMKLRLCNAQNAVPGLARGQDSLFCQELTHPRSVRPLRGVPARRLAPPSRSSGPKS